MYLRPWAAPPNYSQVLSEGNVRESEATYQLQSVNMIVFDVVHDSPVRHPLRHSDELPPLPILQNSNKVQDVRVGEGFPEDNFPVKSLE